MQRLTTFLLVLTATLISTGCSMMAPQYTASLDNVQALKDAGAYTAKAGNFTSELDPANANPIKIRGSSLASPYQNSYGNYLSEAIKQELQLAQRFSPDSTIEISGVLLKNDIDATGFSVGFVTIEARFLVKKSGKTVYEQVKSVRHEFPSAFAGAVAITRAVQEYEFGVRKLLTSLYTDPSFISALK